MFWFDDDLKGLVRAKANNLSMFSPLRNLPLEPELSLAKSLISMALSTRGSWSGFIFSFISFDLKLEALSQEVKLKERFHETI